MKKLLLLIVLFFTGLGLKAQCDIEVSVSSTGWGDNTTWTLTDALGTVVLSGGTYGNGYSDVQVHTAVNPPYSFEITVNTNTFCDNFPDYSITVDGAPDISGSGSGLGIECGGTTGALAVGACPPPICDIEVNVSSPSWGDNTTWTLTDALGTVVLSGGTYGNGYNDTQVHTTANPPYSFEITVNTNTFCDNFPDYTVTVGGAVDISGSGLGIECGGTTGSLAIGACPSCAPPSSVSTSSLSADAATISWVGSAVDYSWEIQPSGVAQGTPGAIASGTALVDTFVATGAILSPATSYTFYVNSNCGGVQSPFSSVDFSTSPACGSNVSGLCYSLVNTQEVLVSFAVSTPGDWATLTFNAGGVETCCDEVIIYDGLNGTGNIIYGALTGGGLADYSGEGTITSTTGQLSLVVNSDVSATCSSSGYTPFDVTLNCVPPPACLAPTALAAGATSSSATLSWTSAETVFDVEWGLAGFVPTGTPSVGFDDVANNVLLPGLTSSTTYEYYVRADCAAGGGTGQSTWAGPFSFTTACSAITTFPSCTDFSVGTGVPACWADLGTDPWLIAGTWPDYGVGSFDNSGFLGVDGSTTATGPAVLQTPIYDLSAGTWGNAPRLRFDIVSNNINTPGDNALVTVSISTDFGLTFTTLTTYQGDNPTAVEVIADLSAYATASVIFQFDVDFGVMTNSTFYNDILLNNICVEETPSCVAPTSVTATVISFDSAQIDYTPFGTSDSTFIEYGVSGFTPGTGTLVSSTGDSAVLSGLSGATSYDVYTFSDCSGSTADSSLIAGPVTFLTPCAPYIPVYFEDFNTWTGTTSLPLCWEEYDQTTPATFASATPSTSGQWLQDGFGNNGSSPYSVTATVGAARIELWNLSDQDWLVSPEIDLSTGGPYQLDFNWTITRWNLTTFEQISDDDYVAVLITTDNGVTWTELGRYDSSTVITPTPLGETAIYDLTAYSGSVVRIGFFGDEGTVDDVSDVNFYMDNFRVRPIPTCPEPIGLTVGNLAFDAVDLSWTETGSATAWEVEYGAPGFTPGTGTVVAVPPGTSSTTVTGLMEQTTYEFVVRAICAPGDSSAYSFAASATTLCAPISTPTPGPETFELVAPASFGDLGNCWTASPTAGFRWESENASGINENSSNTGPFTDHTLAPAAGGIYMYTEASSGSAGDTAFLNSPLVDLSGLAFPNVSFWYHMYGATIGDLLFQINDGNGWTTLTTISGQQQTAGGDEWLEFSANITNYSGIVQFRFVGVRGTSFTGDISIDDFSIQEAPTNDLAVSSIDAPMSGCGMESTPITITVDNNGANTLLYVPVVIQLTGDFAGVYTLVVDTLPALSTVQLTLDSINTLAGGLTDITAFTNLANDSDPSNDTSIVSLTFGAVPSTPVIADVVACAGESVDLGFASAGLLSWFESDTSSLPFFQGDTLTVLVADTTFYVSQQATILGCPSDLTMVQLSTTPTYLDTVVMTACDSMVIGGVAQTTSGFYTDSLTSAAGCDSIVVFDLTINNSFAEARSASICDNSTFTLPDGVVVNTAGTYTSVLTAANGCDSVITYTVDVVSSFALVQDLEACDGDTVVVGTSVYTTTGSYVDSLLSAGGCDSVVTTNLVVYPTVDVTIGGVTVVCESAPAVDLALDPVGGVLSGPGVVDSTTFDPAAAGVGVATLTYTFEDGNGCDATASLDVEVVVCTGIEDIDGIEALSIYPNPYISSINLLFDDAVAGELNITLFDVTGRVLKAESVMTTIGANTISINVSPEVASGVHILQIERDGAVYSTTLIKK